MKEQMLLEDATAEGYEMGKSDGIEIGKSQGIEIGRDEGSKDTYKSLIFMWLNIGKTPWR